MTDYPRDLFGARLNEYEVPHGAYQTNCQSCGAAMVWVQTPKGASMPLSVATIETRDGIRYAMPHFVDCPDAKNWSKQR